MKNADSGYYYGQEAMVQAYIYKEYSPEFSIVFCLSILRF